MSSLRVSWRTPKPIGKNINRVFSEILKHDGLLNMKIMDSENERETFDTNKG